MTELYYKSDLLELKTEFCSKEDRENIFSFIKSIEKDRYDSLLKEINELKDKYQSLEKTTKTNILHLSTLRMKHEGYLPHICDPIDLSEEELKEYYNKISEYAKSLFKIDINE